jgi:hypothetical protein
MSPLPGLYRRFAPIGIRGLIFLPCILAIAALAKADDLSDRREAAAQRLANELARSAVHRIYVPDFTDASGEHIVLGRFLATTFSTLLHDNAKSFAVVNRIDAHRYLGVCTALCSLPDRTGEPKRDGAVHLYVLITVEGKADEIRVTKSLDPASIALRSRECGPGVLNLQRTRTAR